MSFDSDDWRLLNPVEHLYEENIIPMDGETLLQLAPELTRCSFCWLSVGENLTEQWYLSELKQDCICEQCVQDFQSEFDWTLLDGFDI